MPAPLSFQRTVDRALVHRASIAEVFVVDSVAVSENRCVIGAHLPRNHSYYSDHTAAPARYDPLLLLESSRQAAIYGSHELKGLGLGSAMIVGSYSIRLSDVDATITGTTAGTGQLVLDTTYLGRPTKRGRVRNGRVVQELELDGRPIGTHEMATTIVTTAENEALRTFRRGSPPPSSADYVGRVDGVRAEPHEVGRRDPRNVVLTNLRRADRRASATVSPDFANTALFDHAYDHLPAMVITEAARQLALATVDDGSGARIARHAVTAIAATFHSYGELDARLTAEAVADEGGPTRVDVTFTQGATAVATVSVEILLPEGD
jgi:hypothetical protein